ncbi:hypothetical protein [Phenylobacterium soli]|uniref:DUF2909 domain-containing protein n=1 Tax=Phenylobacterium soli TaxID=2170551 RepID=A0A328ALT3_9CAUL|nr:hypothetical protein [Phenylobacterium soli]RAK54384.1 hypothetical protein DJ017_07535 [Phenylobacterium soli]
MSLSLTLALLAGCVVLGAFCGWRGAAPPNPHKGPRLIPYRFLMALFGAVGLYLTAHVLNLFGVITGR